MRIFIVILILFYFFRDKSTKQVGQTVNKFPLDLTDNAKLFLSNVLAVQNHNGELIKTGDNKYVWKTRDGNEVVKTLSKQDLINLMPDKTIKVFINE